jgi:hypothetical protein
MQMLFIAWLYGEQNQVRPMFPSNTPREDLIRASKSFDLAQHLPPVDWSQALWHLPVQDIINHVVVRRVGRTEPRALQPRAQHRLALTVAKRPTSSTAGEPRR